MSDHIQDHLRELDKENVAKAPKPPKTLSELISSEKRWRDRRDRRRNGPSVPTKPIPRVTPVQLDYETAKRTFWEEYKKILRPATPIVREDNAPIITAMLKYYINAPDNPIPENKSAYVVGEYGSGKSKLMKSILYTTRRHPEGICHRPVWIAYKAFKRKTPSGIMLDELVAEWSNTPLIIDDLGYEEDDRTTRSNVYGTVTNIVQELVRARYESYQNNGVTTDWTSNKSLEEIRDLYGDGTYTRLKEMSVQILWNGQSLRK